MARAEHDPEHTGGNTDEGDESDESRKAPRERQEPRSVDGMRPRMSPLLGRDQLDRGRQWREVDRDNSSMIHQMATAQRAAGCDDQAWSFAR